MTNPYLKIVEEDFAARGFSPALAPDAGPDTSDAPAAPDTPSMADTLGAPDPMEVAGELGAGFITTPPDEPEENPYLARMEHDQELARNHLQFALKVNPSEAAKVWKLARETGYNPDSLLDSESYRTISDIELTEVSMHLLGNAPTAMRLMSETPWMARLMRDSLPEIVEIEAAYRQAADILHAVEQNKYYYTEAERAAGLGASLASGFAQVGEMSFGGLGQGVDLLHRSYAQWVELIPGVDHGSIPLLTRWTEGTLHSPGRWFGELAEDWRQIEKYQGTEFDFAAGFGQYGGQFLTYLTPGGWGNLVLPAQGMFMVHEKVKDDDAPQAHKDLAVLLGAPMMYLSQKLSFDILKGRLGAGMGATTATAFRQIAAATHTPGLAILGSQIGRSLDHTAVQALTRFFFAGIAEGAQEVFEEVAGDAFRKGLTDPTARIGLAEELENREVGETLHGGKIGFLVGGAASLVQDVVLYGIKAGGKRRLRRAQEDLSAFEKMFTAAAQAEALKQDPESFAQVVGEITEGATVFVDPDRLTEALTGAGIELSQLPTAQAVIEGTEQSPPAQPGMEIEIPLSELVAALSGTGAEKALLPYIRANPGRQTLAEARADAEQAVEFFQAEAERILEDGRKGVEFTAAAAAVEVEIREQLDARLAARPMKGANSRTSEAYSKLVGAFYTAVADRIGITPLQLRDGWTDQAGRQHRGYRLRIMEGVEVPSPASPTFEQFPRATLSTFTREGIESLLDTSDWVVVTAANPQAKPLSDAENAKRNAVLEAELQAMGLEYTPTLGKYGLREPGFAVVGLDYVAAAKLGAKYDQESVLTRYGLVYPDGTVDRATGLTVHEGVLPDDYFTTLPDGTAFTVELQFNREPLADVIRDRDGTEMEGLASFAQSVSTRLPKGKGLPDPHLSTGLDVDYSIVANDPDYQKKLADVMRGWAPFRVTARNPAAVLEQVLSQMQNNLRWLYDQVPAEIRERSRKWYDGARQIVDRWVDKYDGRYTDSQISGVLAAMSPQLGWDANVSLAERIIDVWTEQQDTPWSAEMEAKAAELFEKPSTEGYDALQRIRGLRLGELESDYDRGVWIRVYDQTYNPRGYRQVTPEGGWGDWMQNAPDKKGRRARTKSGWQNGHHTIGSAVGILRDGGIENISRQLGQEHKVRNFYNNIFDPSDPTSLTVDTHAVAAVHLSPLAGSSPEVNANFGAPEASALGLSGTYVVYVEAYRRLAAELGILPRELQSIVWEAVRRMYTVPFKSAYSKKEGPKGRKQLTATARAMQATLRGIWMDYTTGKETIDVTHERVREFAGGIQDPGWAESGSGLDAGAPDSSYTEAILVSGWTGRPAADRTGTEVTGRDQEDVLDEGRAGRLDQSGVRAGDESGRLTQPPVNEDGTVTLWHWGRVPSLSALDPNMSGTGINGADLRRRDADPDNWTPRTYYGLALGQDGGYRKESGLGPNLYSTTIPAERLYDMAADPDGLRPLPGEITGWDNPTSVFEKRIKDAGYAGFWVAHPQLGLTSAVFEKLAAKPAEIPGGVFEQGPALTGQDAEIAAAFEDWAANDPRAVDDYISRFGHKVDPDEAKTFSPEYVADPMRMARVVHEGSSILAKRVYTHLLGVAPPGAPVVFSAGGGGSGKTESLQFIPGSEDAGVLYDSVLGNYDSAKNRIEQALASGRPVLIAYTNRPVMDAWRFALHRPRVVPAQTLAGAHVGASNTIRKLAQEYAGDDRVTILVVRNAGRKADRGLGAIDEVYNYDYNKVVEELVAEARRQYEQGQITEERFLAAIREQGVGRAVDGQHPRGVEGLREPGRGTLGHGEGGVAEARGTGAPAQVDTPAFKKWFGDSKVVVADGKPRVMYHATTSDFEVFKEGLIYVAETGAAASAYARRFGYVKRGEEHEGGQVMPLFVKAENPFDYANEEHRDWLIAELKESGLWDEVDISSDEDWMPLFDSREEALAAGDTDAYRSRGLSKIIAKRFDSFYSVSRGVRNLAVFSNLQVKSAVGNVGTFDATDPSILRQGERGRFAPETMELALLAKADLSTFLHETGHFFLSVYTDLALQPGAPAELRADMQTFLNQFANGVTPEEWAARSVNEQRKAHEAFAESFEQYLFEGKAPTAELKALFRKFTSFLKKTYTSIRNFLATSGTNADLNPELAAVFDRMLATDAQIEAARQARNYRQLFASAAEAGMTPAKFADYMELDAESRDEAQEKFRVRSLRDIRWVQSLLNKTIAALQKTAKARRAEVEAEVTAEVEQEPIYRAMTFLRKGTTTDAMGNEIQATEGFKLSIPALEMLFPKGSLSPTANWRALGTGKNGMIAKEGLDPQMVAEVFGFRSAEHLVLSLLEAQPMKVEIEGRTDQRMLQEHGDLATPEGIQRAADEAIHNDARSRMVATELAALKAGIGSPAALLRAAKALAAETVGRMDIRTLRPWRFAAASARAGKAALEALAKGDRAEAVRQKRIELLNHVTAKQAYEAVREMEKMLGRFKRMAAAKDADAVKTRDMDMVNAVRVVLAGYGFMTQARTDKAKNYLEVVAANDEARGQALVDNVQAAMDNAKDWRELTFDEMSELYETVKGLWDEARASRQIEIDGKRVELAKVHDELTKRVMKLGVPAEGRGKKHAITKWQNRELSFRSMWNAIRRVAQWARGMDGGHDGPFRRYIWYPIKDAADRYRVERMAYIRRYRDLLQGASSNWAPGTIDAPELGYVFGRDHAGIGKAELLHAILHTGNKSNKKKLLIGREWATLNPDGTVNTGPLPDGRAGWDAFIARMIEQGKLTKADFDFAQGVWDMLEDMKPGAQRAHRLVFGRYFDEVTADSFETPWGTYRGGYVPAKVDARLVGDAELRSLEQIEKDNMQFSFPSTPKGFTMARVDYNRPLKLDLRTLSQHMDEVLIFSHMTPAVNDVRRVISGVSGVLDRYDPAIMKSMLVPWLKRSAQQRVQARSEDGAFLDDMLHGLRTRTGAALMFGNMTNVLQQFTGISLAMVLVTPANLGAATGQFLTNPLETLAFIRERSLFMQDRLNNQNALMYDNVKEILLNPSALEKAQNWSLRNAYIFQIMTDRLLAPVVWLGAYNQALADAPAGMKESDAALRARRAADSAVQETQMDQSPEGIAAFESGSAWRRMFTQFTGWFNMSLMTMEAEFKTAGQDPSLLRRHARRIQVVMLGLLVPGATSEIIAVAMRGGPEDDDDDGYLDDWLSTVGWGTFRYGTAMIPFGGQAFNALFTGFSERPYDAKMLGTPAIGAVEAGMRSGAWATQFLFDPEGAMEKRPGRTIRDTGLAINAVTGLPTNLLAKPIAFTADVVTGHVVPTSDADFVRGMITGTPSPDSK